MANTVIQLKKSATPSATPTDLANGELAINYADGKIFYKAANGAIYSIVADPLTFSTVNANGTLIIADVNEDILSFVPGDFITITGDAINDKITITAAVQEIYNVANAAFNAANSVSGGIDVTGVYNTTNAAFDKANSANVLAYNTGIGANNYAGAMANAANAYAASLTPDLSPAFNVANAAFDKANTASNDLANTAVSANNYAGAMANAANAYAASLTPDLSPVFVVANTAFDKANAANVLAYNTGIGANAYTNVSVGAANNYAGAMANSANAFASATFGTVTNTTGAFAAANQAGVIANAAFSATNNEYTFTNTVYTAVNSAFGVINATYTSANANYVVTNAAFAVANAAYGNANSIAISANAYAGAMANSSNNYANNTFLKLTAPSQILTGSLEITGNLILSGNATSISTDNLSVQDPMIFLAANNVSDVVDIGFVGHYNNGTANVHTGIYRDHGSKEYFLFNGLSGEPELTNDIVPYANNMVNAVLNSDVRTSNLNLGGANAIVWIRTAFDTVNAAYTSSNADFTLTNAAFTQSNTDNVRLSAAYVSLNAAFAVANAAYGNANSIAVSANNYAGVMANSVNSAFATADSGVRAYVNTSTTAANNYAGVMANAANAIASATYATITTVATNATSANNYAGAMANSGNAWATATFATITNAAAAFAAANAKVASVSGTSGRITSSGGTTPAIDLATSGVVASTYGGATQIPVLAIDTYGRVTGASNVAVSGMDYVYVNTSTTAANNYAGFMANSGNAWATATFATITNATAAFAAANAKVASVSGTSGRITSSGGTTPTIDLATSGVTATIYGGSTNIPVITVDAYGRITSAANQSFSAGGVTSVSGTAGRITSSGGSTPVIDLATAGAGAATYSSGISSVTVDAYGRVTSVTGSAGYVTSSGVTSVATGVGLTGGTITSTGTISLATYSSGSNAAVSGGISSITVDEYGRVRAVTGSAGYLTSAVTSVAAGTGLSGGTITSTGTISMPNVGPGAGSYSSGISAITLDAQGRVTAITGSAGYVTSSGVTSIAAGTGLSGGTITSTGTISMPNTGPGAGSYSGGISAITIDAQGRITAITGSAGYASGSFLPLSGGTMTGLLIGQNTTTSGIGGGNDTGSFSIRGDASRSAHVSFHRTGAYAINMGLDTDNVFRIGGWSDGASSFRLQLAAPGGTHTFNGIVSATSDVRAPIFYDSNDTIVRWDAGVFVLRSGSPTIYFRDTDHNSAMLHNNSNLFYVLRGGNDTESWTQVSGQWPLIINLTNNDCTVGGSFAAIGNVTAYASDRRLKENIKEIPNAIEKIRAIRGVTFDWNEISEQNGFIPSRKYGDVGCIAQEIEAVLPQVVTLAPFDVWCQEPGKHYTEEEIATKSGTSKSGENYLTVQYDKIVPLLIQAIKEQQEQIDELKQSIAVEK